MSHSIYCAVVVGIIVCRYVTLFCNSVLLQSALKDLIAWCCEDITPRMIAFHFGKARYLSFPLCCFELCMFSLLIVQ